MADKVKLMRSPVETVCNDCNIEIHFGVYCYFNEETADAVCVDCGVEHGWSDKQRVKLLIKKKELNLDIKALRRVRELESRELARIKRKVKIFRLAETHIQIEQDYLNLSDKVESYLNKCGTAEEKETFKKVFEAAEKVLETQKAVDKEVFDQLYLLDKEELRDKEKEKKRKKKMVVQNQNE
jgi:hypothetical protein